VTSNRCTHTHTHRRIFARLHDDRSPRRLHADVLHVPELLLLLLTLATSTVRRGHDARDDAADDGDDDDGAGDAVYSVRWLLLLLDVEWYLPKPTACQPAGSRAFARSVSSGAPVDNMGSEAV
jgi:hypothetical protein